MRENINTKTAISLILQKYMIKQDTHEALMAHLKEKGVDRAGSTVYNWAEGNANTTPEIFLEICRFYKVKNPYEFYPGNTKMETWELSAMEREIIMMLRKRKHVMKLIYELLSSIKPDPQ